MQREAAVREAFREQARWCERLGSPFTSRLCAVLAEALDPDTRIGRRVLAWTGEPMRDALALRLCGGLHALVRAGEAPELASLYPPAPPASAQVLLRAVSKALVEHAQALDPWLDSAPQTNEVGRSAALMGGLLVLTDQFGLPFRLFEVGASAGLNLQLDRYGYVLGGIPAGDRGAPVQLAPEWRGTPPPTAQVIVRDRAGVDLNPVDPVSDKARLLAYVWPDQPRRLAQLEAALEMAADDVPPVARGDAADWLEAQLAVEPERGVCRVVLHSVAFVYFPPETQQRIRTRLAEAGGRASEAAPLAWLRLEKRAEDEHFSLRLRSWPGEDRLLAWSHPHGSWMEWLAGD